MISKELPNSVLEPECLGGGGGRGYKWVFFLFIGRAITEGYRVQTWPKNPKMAPFSEHLSADMSAEASADALGIINIG